MVLWKKYALQFNKKTVLPPNHPDTVDMHYCYEKLSNQIRFRGLKATKKNEDNYNNNIEENDNEYIPKTKRKVVPKTNIVEIETFLNCIKNEYLNTKTNNKIYNKISKKAYKGISELLKMDNIVPTQCDKTPIWALFNECDYDERMREGIKKENIKKIDSNGIDLCKSKIDEFINANHDILSNKWIDYIQPKEPYQHRYKEAELYGLYKAHKKEYYRKPFRIIESGTKYILNGLDYYIFTKIKQILPFCEYMTIDTKTHCNKLEELKNKYNNNFNNKYIWSLDVVALYPSLDWNFSYWVIRNKINKHQYELGWDDKEIRCIIHGIHILTEHDFSSYGGDYYWRFNGYPMGKIFVPPMTDIVMDYFDMKITIQFKFVIDFYERYRDDIYIQNEATNYEQHIEITNNIHDYANDIHSSIAFTKDLGYNMGKSINFLNTANHIILGKFLMDLFRKSTKICLYLSTLSFHKPSVFDAIPIGLGHMTRCICSDLYIKQRLDELKCDLVFAGFNINKLHKDLDVFYNIDRNQCRNGDYKEFRKLMKNKNYAKFINDINRDLNINEQDTSTSLLSNNNINNSKSTLIINDPGDIWVTSKWHPGVNRLKDLIKKYIHILHSNNNLINYFKEKQFRFSFKRDPNLWEKLHPLQFQRKYLYQKRIDYEKDLENKYKEKILNGSDHMYCKNGHCYKILSDYNNNLLCTKCKSLFMSNKSIFGCIDCQEFICRECINFNCKNLHGLDLKVEIGKICDICDEDIFSKYYGCNICDIDVCIKCFDYKFKYNNMLNFNHLYFDSFLEMVKFNNSNIENNRKGQDFKSEICGRSRCKSCIYINTTNKIKSKVFGINYKLSNKNNCATKNGIYAIECKNCDDQYVGSTVQKYSDRQNGHRGCIKKKKVNVSEVYRHFNQSPCNGGDTDNALHFYSFTPLKTIKLKGNAPEDIVYNEFVLNYEERHYQAKLGTIYGGLNGTSDWNNCNELRRNKSLKDKIPRLFAVDYY